MVTLLHNTHLTRRQLDWTRLKVNEERAFDDDEYFICVCVLMPDKVSFHFGDLQLVVVHLRNYTRAPMVAKGRELFLQVNTLVVKTCGQMVLQFLLEEWPLDS